MYELSAWTEITVRNKEVFSWVSKVILRLPWFLHCYGLWLGKKISCHFLNQSEAKLKPIVTCSHAPAPATCICLIASSSDWFIGLPAPVVIGQINCFGFGFTTHLKTALTLTNRCHFAVCLFSYRTQMTSKCCKNKEVAHWPQASVSLMF